jgi:hypothetical protein
MHHSVRATSVVKPHPAGLAEVAAEASGFSVKHRHPRGCQEVSDPRSTSRSFVRSLVRSYTNSVACSGERAATSDLAALARGPHTERLYVTESHRTTYRDPVVGASRPSRPSGS